MTALDGDAAIFLGHNDPDMLSRRRRRRRAAAPGAAAPGDAAVRARPPVRGRRRRARRRDAGVAACDHVLPGRGGHAGGAGDTAPCRAWCWTWPGSGRPELAATTWCGRCGRWSTGYRQWLTTQAARVGRTRRSRGTPTRVSTALDAARGDRRPARAGDRAAARRRDRRGRRSGSPTRRWRSSACAASGAGADCRRRTPTCTALLRRARRAGEPVVAAVPARVRAAQPAGARPTRRTRTRTADADGARRPAVLPDRRRQDRGVPRPDGVHDRDPPAAGRGRPGRRRTDATAWRC